MHHVTFSLLCFLWAPRGGEAAFLLPIVDVSSSFSCWVVFGSRFNESSGHACKSRAFLLLAAGASATMSCTVVSIHAVCDTKPGVRHGVSHMSCIRVAKVIFATAVRLADPIFTVNTCLLRTAVLSEYKNALFCDLQHVSPLSVVQAKRPCLPP